jgi:signal transduction histidine kinase
MLYEFLVANREKILATTRRKTDVVAQDKPVTAESERGLPQFFDHLTAELKRETKGQAAAPEKDSGPDTTAKHGKELKRLGYTMSQVVQGYSVLAYAIKEAASAARAPITADEAERLSETMDLAISEAVQGFATLTGNADCAQKMGFLTHELRNALTAATVAHNMIRRGIVGHGSNTNAILERNLTRMREILDRSFADIRMQNEKGVEACPVRLAAAVDEVEPTANEEARARGLSLDVEVGPDLTVVADIHYLISAVSNLVQNAIKYSKKGGTIRVRGREEGAKVLLEIEDQCGGLPKGMAEELFEPFVQKNKDKSGLGLGLTISRRAIELIGGTLSVRDLPGKGCIFTIALPKPGAKNAGAAAVEPVPALKAG